MKTLDLTLPTPSENLAHDVELLDACENGGEESLRFWESPDYFVVLGYSNKPELEVNEEACRKDRIPVLKRASGGGTVLQGPGCLNYALILKMDRAPELKSLTQTNQWIMQRHARALTSLLGREVQVKGHTDLALGDLKFSGNAQRRRKETVLFHGTFLVDFDLSKIGRYLKFPSKAPDYRRQRAHEMFLTNLKVSREEIREVLKNEWVKLRS